MKLKLIRTDAAIDISFNQGCIKVYSRRPALQFSDWLSRISA